MAGLVITVSLLFLLSTLLLGFLLLDLKESNVCLNSFFEQPQISVKRVSI